MKTIIFVVLIIASASYLAIGEKSPLSVSADGSTVSVDIEKVSSDVSKQLNEQLGEQVAQQLSSFKNEMVQNQQRQIEALQQSVVNLAQKSAQLERKLEQKLASAPQAEQKQPVVYVEPQITQSQSIANEGPDVGAISKPVDYDELGDGMSNRANQAQNDVLVQVNEVANGALYNAVEGSTDMAMMDKQQRRKRLQNLSERMTLKSLGIEK